MALLRRLLLFLRLLHMSKLKASATGADLSLRKSTGLAVLSLWNDIETQIFHELSIHFTEQSVELISDKAPISRDQIALLKKGRERVNSDVTERRSDNDEEKNSFLLLEQSNSSPLFPSSAQLAAPIYKEVVASSESAYRLLCSDISFEYLVGEDKEGNSVRTCSKLLDLLKHFLEEEYVNFYLPCFFYLTVVHVLTFRLMPVVLGAVNKVMRELQTNNELFLPPTQLQTSSYSSSRAREGINNATRMVFDSLGPLFPLYLDLPQHRDATLTILDRSIRGFISIAREELEAISFKYRSSRAVVMKSIVYGMTQDPIFAAYKTFMFEGKCSSLEELSQLYIPNLSVASASLAMTTPSKPTGPTRRASRIFIGDGGVQKVDNQEAKDGLDRSNCREIDGWGDLWRMGTQFFFS